MSQAFRPNNSIKIKIKDASIYLAEEGMFIFYKKADKGEKRELRRQLY